MIIVTGGAGFIGYNLVEKLIDNGYKDIVVIDNNYNKSNFKPLLNVKYLTVEDSHLWLEFKRNDIEIIFHLGARTDTTEKDVKIFNRLNYNYSILIWNFCAKYDIPLIYASSAATYGDGENGFDDGTLIDDLKPLNPYGESKQSFDLYAKYCFSKPPNWFGFKFFNVYGNHEQHKGNMASVIWHFYNQIKKTGEVKLFKSHVDYYNNGEQKRDFIHVDDVVNVLIWSYESRKRIPSKIYNLGTGIPRTYNDLTKIIFKCLGKEVKISYVDTPLEIRSSYQYYTRAKMDKLAQYLRWGEFKTLEEGIETYIKQLENENC